MPQLRPYQLRAVEDLREKIRAGSRRLVLVAPTGSGKTIIAAHVIQQAVSKGNRSLLVAHRRELLGQASEKLDAIGVDHGVMLATHWRTDPSKPVQVASVQTLRRRTPPKAELVVIDEAHLCLAKTYMNLIRNHYADSIIIGMSATPWRLDGKGLNAVYQDLVLTASVRDLVEQGYLVRSRVFAPHRPDLAGVHSVAGDYRQDELAKAVNKTKIVGDIVDHWRRLAEGRRTVVFAAGVDHSKHIAESFRVAGVVAEHADGSLSGAKREDIIRRVRSGEIEVLCNADLVVEGLDVPQLSCCILARPTQSSVRYLQMVGRVARPSPGKADALILDHAGCVFRHGFPSDDREYSLEDSERRKDDDEAPVKICRECFAVMLATARVCPECGAVPEVISGPGRRGPETQDGELAEIIPGDVVTCRKCRGTDTRTFKGNGLGAFTTGLRCMTCNETSFITDHLAARNAGRSAKEAEWKRLEEIRIKRGYKPGFTAHKFRSLFGVWPRGMKDVS